MKPTVLHIANYYIGARVYQNLVGALDKLDTTQIIYTAFADPTLTGANKPNLSIADSRIVYRQILNFYTRLNYNYKVRKITKDIQQQVNIENVNCIHAHTLFSDGRIAYNLFKKFNKPYIVTVRNTDINFFFKYFLHLRGQAKQTLLGAQRIVFISEAYRRRLLAHPYFRDIQTQLANKSVVVPNGIDDYWINNTSPMHKAVSSPVKLLFVGKFNKGKNLTRLMDVVLRINAIQPTTLHIAGVGNGKYYQECIEKIKQHPQVFYYHGNINDKALLRALYGGSDIFVMPSKSETFGLVYVEALSQGIPILYTRNEGIDGFFSEKIGEAAISSSEVDIYDKIVKIINNYPSYTFDPQSITSLLNWNLIAQKYVSIYKLSI